MRVPGPLLNAALAGILLGVAFLPGPFPFLAWFAFVPLLDALQNALRGEVRMRALFTIGWTFGLAFFLLGMHWIGLLSDVAMTHPWLKYPAWLLAAGYLAIFPGLMCMLCGALVRHARASLAVAFPLALVVLEEVRGSGELGFPWFQPGYTQAGYVPLLQMVSLGGVMLLTLWVALLNVLLWRALAGRQRGVALAGAVLALLLPWVWGHRALAAAPRGKGVPVALIQANVAGEMKWSGLHQREILQTFLRLSEEATRAEPRPELIIWPETATGSWLARQPEQLVPLTAFVATNRVPVFAGYADYDPPASEKSRRYNAAGLFTAEGPGERYAKRHLVPFGERMPFQGVLPFLGGLEFGQAEWTPGKRAVLFPSAAGPFGCLVCFESIFPDLSRRDVRAGARWLVNVTNDEWFGNSAALRQHAVMAAVRAAENHVPVARCANTGLTVLYDASGRIVASLPVFAPGMLKVEVPPPGRPTPFTRFGDWPGMLCAAACAFLFARAAISPGPRVR